VSLDNPLRRIVISLAQALKRAQPELVDVALVRFDVIADFRRRDDAALQAELAERIRDQLLLPNPGPAPGAVPSVPLRRLTADAQKNPGSGFP
jgi:hypothetical protein